MGKDNIIFGIITLILLVCIVGLFVFNISVPKKQSGFTELYFVGDIPKKAQPGYEYPFSFAIHNLENYDIYYIYSININSSIIEKKYELVKQGETRFVNKNFVFDEEYVNSSVRVSVRLLNKEQEIHFWVDVI